MVAITKIKLLPRTTLKYKSKTSIAGSITAGNGITVVNAAGVWTISLDTAGSSVVTGPVLSTDNAVPRFDGTDGTILQNSNVTISDLGVMTVNANAAALQTPSNGTLLHVGNADGLTSRVTIDAYGTAGSVAVPALTFRAARGTAATPSAVQDNDTLGALTWNAYGATGHAVTGRALIVGAAAENWTDSAHGTKLDFYTTPAGVVAPAKVVAISDGGTLTVTPTASTYNHAIDVTQTGSTSSIAGPQNYNLFTVTHQGSVTGSGRDEYGLRATNGTAFRVNMDLRGTLTSTSSAGIFAVKDVTDNTSPTEKIGLNGTIYSTTQDSGALYAFVSYAYLDGTGIKQAVLGADIDVGIRDTADADYVIGLNVSLQAFPTGPAGVGNLVHSAYTVNGAVPDAAAFGAIMTLMTNGAGPPMSSTGSFFKAQSAVTMANVFDALNWTVTGDILKFPNVNLTGAGVLTLDANTAALAAPTVGTMLHLGNADGSVTRAVFDSFGIFSAINFRHTRGTSASKTATQSGDAIASVFGLGYGASQYMTNSGAGIVVTAVEPGGFTNSAAGTRLDLYATSNGGTVTAAKAYLQDGFSVGSSTDPGAGVINASTGYRVAGAAAAGNRLRGNGTNFVSASIGVDLGQVGYIVNGTIAESHASNAATYAVKTLAGADPSASDPVYFVFRNSTAATGTYVVRAVTGALSVTITSTATLGHASARDQQVFGYAIDNAGTVELAVSNKFFDPGVTGRLVTTTTMSSGATNAATMYSTTGRSNVAWIPIFRAVSQQATAGTWVTSPSLIELAPFVLPTNTARLYIGTTQTLTDNTETKLNFDTAVFDPDTVYVSSGKLQPKVSGTYDVKAMCYMAGSGAAGTEALISIYKNGTADALSFCSSASNEAGPVVGALIQMNGTSDYLEVQARLDVTSGSVSAGLTATPRLSMFSCTRIGP